MDTTTSPDQEALINDAGADVTAHNEAMDAMLIDPSAYDGPFVSEPKSSEWVADLTTRRYAIDLDKGARRVMAWTNKVDATSLSVAVIDNANHSIETATLDRSDVEALVAGLTQWLEGRGI